MVPTTLSIPTNLVAGRGGSVLVPINVDILSDLNPDPAIGHQSGLSGGVFVLWYNPSVLSVNLATGIGLGTLGNPSISGDGFSPATPNGWSISSPNSPNPGELAFGIGNSNGVFVSGTGGGSLAVINFHVLANAPLGASMLDLAHDIGGPGSQPSTSISDDIDSTGASLTYALGPNPSYNPPPFSGPTDNTGAEQIITFGGTVTGGTFTLAFSGATTAPITYSSTASTLQSNIQTALNNPNLLGQGNTIVNVPSATSASITFEGAFGGGQTLPPFTAISSLSGVSPTITVTTTGPSGQPLFAYYGSDPTDGSVSVINLPPVTVSDSYSITERDVGTDPGLSVAAPGVLANDTSLQGNSLTPSLVNPPTNGSITFNSDGSFVYTPNTGYLGADSFTYQDTDSQTGLTSNITTVNLTVTARLSIPTSLTANPGQTITVPVNLDNPNPLGSGGLTGAALAIDFDSNELQFGNALPGTVTGATNEVQTISFGGTITGGTFTLTFTNAPVGNAIATTAPISYSAVPSTLQSNIQSALSNLSIIGTAGTSPNALVAFNSVTAGTVTFQNSLGHAYFKTLTVASNLVGVNPTATVATTITGQTNWTLSSTSNNTSGQLGIAEIAANGQPQLTTIGGSIVQLVFTVKAGAPAGSTDILIVPSNAPFSQFVTTSLGFDGTLTLPPRPQLQPYPTFVAGVDAIVTVSGTSRFVINTPATTTAGVAFTFTVLAEDSSNNLNTGYSGTVHFTSSDSLAVLPPDATLTNGVGTFGITLKTVGSQSITAADAAAKSISGFSNGITVTVPGHPATHFGLVSFPTPASAGSSFSLTLEALDASNNLDTSFNGTAHLTSSDSQAVLPAIVTLTNGVGVFSATLKSSGSQTLTAVGLGGGSSFVQAPNPSTDLAANPIAMAVGDFNGDGNADLAIVNNGNSSVSIFLGNGNGTFAAGQVYGVGISPIGVTVADFNGDGKLDLVVANASNAGPSSVSVLLGNGNGTFRAATNYGVGGTVGVAVGDFNGDGKLDLAVGHAGNPGYIAMLLGNGDGTFQQGPISPSDNVPDSIGSADFNHDGKLDVAIANYSTNIISVQLGIGDGTFGPATDYGVGSYPFSVAIGDFNGDGNPDLAIPNVASNTLSILLGNGNGTFKPATTITGQNGPLSVAVADFNGDGKLDLAVTNSTTVNVLLGNGNGTFAAGATLPVSGGVGIGDFNGDGAVDVAVSNPHLGSPTLHNVIAFINQRVQTLATVSVNPAAASHLVVSGVPANVTAGTPFSFTVTAEDQFNNIASGYAGAVHFTSSDNQASLPANANLIAGVGSFSATLNTRGSQVLTVSDAVTSSITGTSPSITVSGASPHFVLSAPTTASAGSPLTFTVTADGANNNVFTGYSGTVHFTSSDAAAILPADATLTSGVGVFSATLGTPGSQTLMASDIANSISGLSASITVSGASLPQLSITSASAVEGDQTPHYRGAFVYGDPGTQFNPVTFGPDGNLYTAVGEGPGYNTIERFNGTTGAFMGTFVPTGTINGPRDIVFQGGYMYVASEYTNQVLRYVASTGAYAGVFVSAGSGGINGPYGMTFGPDGNLYVTGRNSNNVVSYNGTTGALIGTFVASGSGGLDLPEGLTFDPSGSYLYVASATTPGAVLQFNAHTGAYTGLAIGAGVSDPVGVKFGSDGLIYVLSAGNNRILRFTEANVYVNDYVPAGSGGMSRAQFMTFGPNGDLYVTTTFNNQIFDFGTENEAVFTVTLSAPFTLPVTVSYATANGTAIAGTAYAATSGTLTFAPGVTSETIRVPILTNTAAEPAQSFTVNLSNAVEATISQGQGVGTISAHPAAAVEQFAVTGPAFATAGNAFTFTVTAQDQFGNTAVDYQGTVKLASSDSQAALPASATLTSGVGVFTVTLQTFGNQSLIATDSVTGIMGVSPPIDVGASTAVHFSISAPSAEPAGSLFVYTVTALDPFNNLDTGYTGTVHFTSSDSQALLPGNAQLNNGIGFFGAALRTAGRDTLIATDTVSTAITGNITITVSAANATHFGVVAPASTAPNTPIVFTVAALDQFNNTATNYAGTVNFTSSDSQAFFSASGPLTSGVGHFAADFLTIGTQTITAMDSATASIMGTSNPIIVGTISTTTTHFALGTPGAVAAGSAFSVTVTAEDQFNDTAANYTGLVHFSSSDSLAVLPANVTLTGGVGIFSATLLTRGNQTLTASDTANHVTGTSGPIAVADLVVTSFTPTPSGFTVTFNEPINPSTVNLYTLPSAALPDDVTLVTGGTQVSIRGSLLIDPSDTSITFVKTAGITASGTFDPSSGLLAAGQYTVTLRSFTAGGSGFQDAFGEALDGTDSGAPGSNFQTTFSVSAPPIAVGIPDFARGPSNTDAIAITPTSGAPFLPDAAIYVVNNGQTVPFALNGFYMHASSQDATQTTLVMDYDLVSANGNFDADITIQITPNPDGTLNVAALAREDETHQFSLLGPNGQTLVDNFEPGMSFTFPAPPGTQLPATFALSYTNPLATPSTGTATITFSTNAATLQSNIQAALTTGGLAAQIGTSSPLNTPNALVQVTSDGSAGANILVTFQNALAQSTNQLLVSNTANVSVSRASINAANSIPSAGIPIALSDGLARIIHGLSTCEDFQLVQKHTVFRPFVASQLLASVCVEIAVGHE